MRVIIKTQVREYEIHSEKFPHVEVNDILKHSVNDKLTDRERRNLQHRLNVEKFMEDVEEMTIRIMPA